MAIAVAVVLLGAVAAVLGGWAYFRRYRVTRPPIGVVDRGDVVFMVGSILLVPYLYLWLPAGIVLALLALGTLGILLLVLEPVLSRGPVRWLVALSLVAADIVLARTAGVGDWRYFAVNDLTLLLVVVGVTNLWAQSGMRARDAATLGGFLAVYDLLATSVSSLTVNMVARLTDLPFLPVFAWGSRDDEWLAVGLGDLLFATVFPLVVRKAYGRGAGLVAVGIALVAVGGVVVVAAAGAIEGAFPVMTVLGPLMVLQFLFWSRRLGPERTTGQYLLAEPLGGPPRWRPLGARGDGPASGASIGQPQPARRSG